MKCCVVFSLDCHCQQMMWSTIFPQLLRADIFSFYLFEGEGSLQLHEKAYYYHLLCLKCGSEVMCPNTLQTMTLTLRANSVIGTSLRSSKGCTMICIFITT